MSDAEQTVVSATNNEVDFGELFRMLWAGKWLILSITFATASIAVIVALMLPNIYRAEALLAPNERDGAGGLSSLASQYAGLANLAGIDLGGGSADKSALGLEVLNSRKFITEFIDRRDLLVPLMAAKGWDPGTGELTIDPDEFDVATGKWVRQVSPPKKIVPSAQEAYKAFKSKLTARRDKTTGLVTIAIDHYSPHVAMNWVNWLVEDINSTIMSQDVQEAEQAIEYLNAQVRATSLAGLQSVFFRLIEDQMQTVLLAEASKEYLYKTLDPAIAPEEKAGPKRSLIVILATFLGGFFGIGIQLVRSYRGSC